MSEPLRIAVVVAFPWPPTNEISWRAAREAEALAARGHRVTVLTASVDKQLLGDGRERLERLTHGESEAVLAAPGAMRTIAVGRAIRAGKRRRIADPIDVAAGIERAVEGDTFDIVHVHQPLSAVRLLAALRTTRARTVATFHRTDPGARVAFIGPLVERALARLDARIAVSESVERTLSEVLDGPFEVLRSGVRKVATAHPSRGVMVVSRGRDRAGLRFGLNVARRVGATQVDPLYVVGPREAPWRTRAAVPKALRGVTHVLADDDPDAWMEAIEDVAVLLVASPADATGVIAREARARGRIVIAPETGEDGSSTPRAPRTILVPAFTASEWVTTAREVLASGPPDHGEVPEPATWADVATRLEEIYRHALDGPPRGESSGIVVADLRVRFRCGGDAAALAATCREVGVDVVAIVGSDGVAAAQEVAAQAPEDLTVIAGREIATRDGTVAGLFLTEDVPDGLPTDETLRRIRKQGGITVIPHPEDCRIPSAGLLRELSDLIDCREMATGALGTPGIAAVRDAQALGLVVSTASGARDLGSVGATGMVMRSFTGSQQFLASLADAAPIAPRRGRRARARSRGRAGNT